MNINTKFWLQLCVFQLAFGSVIFFATRHYYTLDESSHEKTPAPVLNEQLSQISPEVLNSLVPSQNRSQNPAQVATEANAFFAAKDYGQAAMLYEQLVNLDPRNADAYNNLGITLHYLGRSSEALQWLEAGSEMDATNQRIWLTRGFVQKELGQAEEARVALQKAVEMGPDNTIGESATRFLSELP